MSARDDIIKVARSYLGTVAGSAAHADIIHIFNTVKPFGYTAHASDPWCAEFVSACAIQAFGKKKAMKYFPLSAACTYMINKAKEMGIWVENDKYIPAKGDFILYDWNDSGYGDNTGQPDHVGIVDYYKHGIIHVIEGNYSNRVKRRNIDIDGRYIRGFITPDYDRIRSASKPEKLKDTDTMVKEVLSGQWGSGAQRKKLLVNAGYDYDIIQNRVNQVIKLTNDTLSGKYGNGDARKKALGNDYDIVQWNINRIYNAKEKEK